MSTVFAIHTGPVLVEVLKPLFAELLPGVRLVNIMDDGLLADVRAAGGLTQGLKERVLQYGKIAEQSGATAILNCCSSVGEAADEMAKSVAISVIKIDDSMCSLAVQKGRRIAVLATVPTTLDPTERLIQRKAEEQGKTVETSRFLAGQAFDALLSGDPAQHDAILRSTILEAAVNHDVIVLAQGSMARLASAVQPETETPILSSPRLGVEAVRSVLETL